MKKIKKLFYYLLGTIYLLFEEIVIKTAKKFLNTLKKLKIYDRIIGYINNSNDIVLLSSFIIIVIIGEIFAGLSVFMLGKGFFLIGILFYILKILVYVPAIDIFKNNKHRLLNYKIVNYFYNLYLKIEKSEVVLFVKKLIKKIKLAIKNKINNIKIFVKKFLRIS